MTCSECARVAGGVTLASRAVRNLLDLYVDVDPRGVSILEARLHNRIRELQVAVRARIAHTQDHIAAAHKGARNA